MEQITAEQIAQAVGGRILSGDGKTPVFDICTDSRKAKPGDLYVPVLGARVDGHAFIGSAIEKGAAAVFTSHPVSDTGGGQPVSADGSGSGQAVLIQVEDTLSALQALGGFCRRRLSIPFVGVTGSVGKTSTRAMIAVALSAGFHTFQTEGNANSQVGVPITLSRIGLEYEAAVIELGMSEPGEMTRIASVSGLNVAVITNIGLSHIEQLGSQEGILREKLHITDGLKKGGALLLNGDDALLYPGALAELKDCREKYRTRYYGFGAHNTYRAEQAGPEGDGMGFTFCYPSGRISVHLPVMGEHHVRNALAALACADVLGVPVLEAAGALRSFQGVAHRQEKLEFPALGISVIDDSYNASPDSMRAAFSTLAMTESRGRKIAVLADMWELGPETRRYHYETGQALARTDVDILVTVGELAAGIAEGAKNERPDLVAESFAERSEAARWLENHRRPGDLILLKGSNGMRLFEIVEAWRKNP